MFDIFNQAKGGFVLRSRQRPAGGGERLWQHILLTLQGSLRKRKQQSEPLILMIK